MLRQTPPNTSLPGTSPYHTSPLWGTNGIVTGASSGIGHQIAIQFATQGCRNLLVHFNRNADAAESTAKQARELGSAAITDHCDFANPEEAASFIDRSFQRWPCVDAWVHCAGADVLTGEAAQWTFEQKLERLIRVDLVGSIMAGRLVGERLRSQAAAAERAAPASMLFIGWDQATEGMEGDAGQMFGPIKAGVEAFSKSLAQELAPDVRVNTISPDGFKPNGASQQASIGTSERRTKPSCTAGERPLISLPPRSFCQRPPTISSPDKRS
jgi:3-oxoacyl-[acyl-carrier protein] reductase